MDRTTPNDLVNTEFEFEFEFEFENQKHLINARAGQQQLITQ